MRTLCYLISLTALSCLAHPIPDIPVVSAFDGAGHCSIRVEIDPRCFEADPNKTPYFLNSQLATMPEEAKTKWKTQAADYVRQTISFLLDGTQELKPAFDFTFTTLESKPLTAPEDPIMITGTWKTDLPATAKTYRLKSLPASTLSVLYYIEARGQRLERFQALFPKEESFELDLAKLEPVRKAPPPIEAPANNELLSNNTGMLAGVLVGVLGVLLLLRKLRGPRA